MPSLLRDLSPNLIHGSHAPNGISIGSAVLQDSWTEIISMQALYSFNSCNIKSLPMPWLWQRFVTFNNSKTWIQSLPVSPFWILTKQEMKGWQWHKLDHMQTNCTSLHTDNYTSTSSLNFLRARCSFWRPTNNVGSIWGANCNHKRQCCRGHQGQDPSNTWPAGARPCFAPLIISLNL